jgi:hypothetical protein
MLRNVAARMRVLVLVFILEFRLFYLPVKSPMQITTERSAAIVLELQTYL